MEINAVICYYIEVILSHRLYQETILCEYY